MSTHNTKLDEILRDLAYNKLPIEATEIGWERVDEDLQDARTELNTLIYDIVMELLDEHATKYGEINGAEIRLKAKELLNG